MTEEIKAYLKALAPTGAPDPETADPIVGFDFEIVAAARNEGFTRHTGGWSQPWIELTRKGRKALDGAQ